MRDHSFRIHLQPSHLTTAGSSRTTMTPAVGSSQGAIEPPVQRVEPIGQFEEAVVVLQVGDKPLWQPSVSMVGAGKGAGQKN